MPPGRRRRKFKTSNFQAMVADSPVFVTSGSSWEDFGSGSSAGYLRGGNAETNAGRCLRPAPPVQSNAQMSLSTAYDKKSSVTSTKRITMRNFGRLLPGILLLFVISYLPAKAATFTSNTYVGPSDFTFDQQDIDV